MLSLSSVAASASAARRRFPVALVSLVVGCPAVPRLERVLLSSPSAAAPPSKDSDSVMSGDRRAVRYDEYYYDVLPTKKNRRAVGGWVCLARA